MDTLNKSIIIATHHLVYGTPQALRELLIEKKIKKLLYISHPLFIDETKSFYEKVENGKITEGKNFPIRTSSNILNYLIESILTLWTIMSRKDRYEYFIGVDSLNAATGILLKKFGYIKKVFFYTIDYVPERFNNSLLNSVYHWIDKFCITHADETWNVSPKIAPARETLKQLPQSKYNRQKVVPIGIWFDRVKRLPFQKIKKHQLFFLGHIMESAGVQYVIDAIPNIVKKIPDFHFLVVGGGDYEVQLHKKVTEMKLQEYVTFTGWVKDRNKLDTIMSDSAVAIALYDKKTSKTTAYSDPTKLKDYLSAGLPIILTDLPHNAHDIEEHKCGIIVNYDARQIAEAVCKLMENSSLLQTYRKNAIEYARQYDWNIIFEKYILPSLT